MQPYSHQSDLIERTSAAYRQTPRVLAIAPCGFGKTLTTAIMAQRALSRGRHPVVSVPRVQLMDQTLNTFREMGMSAGPVGSGADTIIDTMQTLIRRDPVGDFLINDEAHFGLSAAWERYLARYRWLLGLTASPIPGMDRVYEAMVEGPPVGWLIDNGFLSRYRAYGPASPNLSSLPMSGKDYAPGPLSAFMERPSITGPAVDSWLKFAPGLRTIGYSVSRKHSREVVSAFQSRGVPAEHIDGDHTPAERAEIITRFANGETLYLSSVDLITLGFDLSSQIGRDVPIEAMSDQRPTKSHPLHVQKCGRPLRRKPQAAILLDHAGNFERHGLPDDPVEWSIAGRSTRSGGVLPVSICTCCFAAFRTAPVCPECYTPRKLTSREIEQREGELAEIERERTAKARRVEVGRADGLGGLAKIAVDRGYKTGWIIQRMKLKGQPVTYEQAQRAMSLAR